MGVVDASGCGTAEFHVELPPLTLNNIEKCFALYNVVFSECTPIGAADKICPSERSLNDQQGLQTLRDFRDNTLANDLTGLGLIRLYYQHSSEVSKILDANPYLKAEVRGVLKELVKVIKGSFLGDSVNNIIQDAIPVWLESDINSILDKISKQGSNELKAAIKTSRAGLYKE
ncbi:MAG: CFI-box-CTERM domain-containing protein [Candidatus Anammoxibacter sp.]